MNLDKFPLESHPYILRLNGKDCGRFARPEEAVRRAEAMGSKAEVWFVGPVFEKIDWLTQALPRPDRAIGPSALLRGMSTKFVTHRAYRGMVEGRIY